MPGPVAVDLGTPSPRSSFEEINYPTTSAPTAWPVQEELPLHYMSEDKARRRIRPTGPGGPHIHETAPLLDEDDDGGKEVYGKMRAAAVLRQIPRAPPTNFQEDIVEHLPAAIYTLLSCWTRFYQIGKNAHVVWDEAHFGKFGSYYIKVYL